MNLFITKMGLPKTGSPNVLNRISYLSFWRTVLTGTVTV